MNRRDLALFLKTPQAIREYETSLASRTFTDLDNGYDNPDPDAPLAGTTTPTVPTPVPLSAELGIALTCERQPNLTNFDRYEWQVSDNGGTTAYALGFSGTGLGVLNADTDVYVEFLVHRPLPLDVTGGVDNPVAKTWHYRVRRVTKLALESDWSSWTAGQSLPVGSGTLAQNSVYANQIIVTALQALFAKVSYSLTIGFGGTGSEGSPDSGDRRTYIDEDDFKQQIANAAGWEDRVSFGRRAGSNVFDGFVSGFFEAGESVLSSPGLLWTATRETASQLNDVTNGNNKVVAVGNNGTVLVSINDGDTWAAATNPFGTSNVQGVTFGNGWFVAVADGGKIARSADGVSWGSLISNNFSGTDINAVGFGNTRFIAVGASNKLSISTNDGVTWSTITNPLAGTPALYFSTYANSKWVVGGEAVGGTNRVAVSDDNGASWDQIVTNLGNVNGTEVRFGDGVWVTVGLSNNMARSVDNAVTFTAVADPPFSSSAIGALAVGEGVWIAGSNGASISRSVDGGLTWGAKHYGSEGVSQPIGTDGNFFAATYIDSKKRFVVVGYNNTSTVGVALTSDWLEAGSGIVEQGSNSNGEYVIFSNGLQICRGRITHSSTINSAWGNIFISSAKTWTFPAAFSTIPEGVGGSALVGANAAGVLTYSVTTTSIISLLWRGSSDGTTRTWELRPIAIGQRG